MPKKRKTNYKQIGAAGLGGAMLGTLAVRGMYDRKQLSNQEECIRNVEQMKQECIRNVKQMQDKLKKNYSDYYINLLYSNNAFIEKNNKLKNINKDLKGKIKNLTDANNELLKGYNELLNKFGRKRIKRKVNKIPASLKKKCKRLKVRLTVKRKGKRVYKSTKVLKSQCKRKQ